jgi:sigma-B regulation protein RsbU (phosphoserine phosphatase)
MNLEDVPVVFQYQRALDAFRREGREPPLLKRMSELISLLDLTTTLSAGLPGEQILDAALLIVMGELQANRGVLLVRGEGDRYERRAGRGLPSGAPQSVALACPSQAVVRADAGAPHAEVLAAFGLEVLCPVWKGGRPIAALGLGPRAGGQRYGEEESAFLRSVAACAATPIENGLIHHELRRVNQSLSVRVFQLRNLFDLSRELAASFDEESIKNLVATTLMGHLMVSRCALFLPVPGGLALAHQRGLRTAGEGGVIAEAVARPVLDCLGAAKPVAALPPGPLTERLQRDRMAIVVPLWIGARVEGLLALGDKVSGAPFGDEDQDFVQTLGRQALAALEAVRLQRIRLEKERQDRELQIAEEIQQSLFPRSWPAIPGFEVAAQSRACRKVGGDHYDLIPLSGGRVALTVADVSGKGTPASILMASVHASLRALADALPPGALMERLNRFLYESTQANKYVTLFYAELDPAARRLTYVNAGHVPPYLLRADGTQGRLTAGGAVLGLLEGIAFETGTVDLGPGDALALVTDGATEAVSCDDVEFGDERIFGALRTCCGSAAEIMETLVGAVDAWVGAAGCSDDLTVLVLKAN